MYYEVKLAIATVGKTWAASKPSSWTRKLDKNNYNKAEFWFWCMSHCKFISFLLMKNIVYVLRKMCLQQKKACDEYSANEIIFQVGV